jgi:hypothetical protein
MHLLRIYPLQALAYPAASRAAPLHQAEPPDSGVSVRHYAAIQQPNNPTPSTDGSSAQVSPRAWHVADCLQLYGQQPTLSRHAGQVAKSTGLALPGRAD